MVPLTVRVLPRHRVHGGRFRGLQAAHAARHAVVHDLAVHPSGARLHRAGALPVPALHRLSQPRCPTDPDEPRHQTRLGADRHPGPRDRSQRPRCRQIRPERKEQPMSAASATPGTTTTNGVLAGRGRNLGLALLAFTITFWAWNIIGPLGVRYAQELGLSAPEKSLLVATPVLIGSLGRILTG